MNLTNLTRLHPRQDLIYVSQNHTVLVTNLDGFINPGPDCGLFCHQTRLLSRYRWLINGKPPQPVALSNVEQASWLGYYIALSPNADGEGDTEPVGDSKKAAKQPIELRISRFAGDGIRECVVLTNFTRKPVEVTLTLESEADFADKNETKLPQRLQNGKIRRRWRRSSNDKSELAFDYHAEHHFDHQAERGTAKLHRAVLVRITESDSEPSYKRSRIFFKLHIEPRGSWRATLDLIPVLEGDASLPPTASCFQSRDDRFQSGGRTFLVNSTSFKTLESETLAPIVVEALQRAREDLAALRLYDRDRDDRAWTMAAGLPNYIAFFGRDSLIGSYQASLLGPEITAGTLAVMAQLQGEEIDNWRDEQPGRMIHQTNTGPLATLNFNPFGRYYGSITASSFYSLTLSELWRWTGDEQLVQPLIGPALKALKWLDDYADLDGDGFYEYKTHSKQGLKNQGWKDSGDAIPYEDGSDVKPPIATCEEQGFAYLSKVQMSEVLWWFGRKSEAKRLFAEAGELKKRFNEAFWMEELGFMALALDSQKRQVRSIASNPGHCIATAIAEESLVQRTADRLMQQDLFSGWGVRTLSSLHPAFNPYSYHLGSVWPVEQGAFALGFMRYGMHDYVERLCRAQFEAASIFDARRLPELFSGHQRDAEHPFPAQYPNANSPQAWSSSAVFSLVQAILGLHPYAPLNILLVDPHLPEWLPELTLTKLRVGDAAVTIRFYRQADGSSNYETLENRGSLHVLRHPAPWSLTENFAERVRDTLLSLLPSK
ncbi:MAG TPA: glycogen debranching N-terminal domain-containing protein [Candidatus Udaeobacter sp.]